MSEQAYKLVVLVSGGGSNLQAIIDAIESKRLEAEIVQVISNRKSAYALERAQNHHIPAIVHALKSYKDDGRGRTQYDLDLADIINDLSPDLIVLAGWMHILSEAFLNRVSADVINLHPALPGQFAGIHAIERAYEAYQQGDITHSGCMIHRVISEVDAGEVVVQADVPMYEDDSLDDFAERMHQTEHRIIVEAIQALKQQS